jgi:hypothetical protein
MKKKGLDPIVKFTTNYEIFKFLEGNRRVNQLNLRRVIASMREKPLVTIIYVNEKMQIIDGQHRFLALKELGLPINYVIVHGYGIDEVQILNAIGMNWTKADYLETYISNGNENYIKFKQFKEFFPKLTFSTSLRLLSGFASIKQETFDGGVYGKSKEFENGNFVVADYPTACKYAYMIMDFEPHFKSFSDLTFCLTLLNIFKHPNYDHQRMMKRLVSQPNSIRGCKNQKQYHDLLEEIYNYKSRTKLSLSTYLQK